VGSLEIVEGESRGQGSLPFVGVPVWAGVGPLGEQHTNEPLGLAVRLRAVGGREALADPERQRGGAERDAPIAAAVVHQRAFDGNGHGRKPRCGALEEAGLVGLGLVGRTSA
jgi:hypothetical protein